MTTTTRTEFEAPPADPIGLFRDWFDDAKQDGVREPGALALATADARGRVTSRIVQIIEVTDVALVFTSHADSRKGHDIEATGRASGVLYWRETSRQVTLAGPVHRMTHAESDDIWAARPVETHPMSVASHQDAPLADEEALRAAAARLAESGNPLPRPAGWSGYLLAPDEMEFWQGSPDRLHRRLRYDRADGGWRTQRLQP